MKTIADGSMEEFEGVALEGARQLKAFFAYQGDNAKYFQKARLGAVAISGYARLRASETNRIAVELAAKRQK
jgi:hypothetical protein